MFASQETILDLPFPVARTRLVSLARRGGLDGASGRAYADGYTATIRAGPFGQARAASKLVRVRFVEPPEHDDLAVLPFRWEATGPAGGLFPVLDADITLLPAGGQTKLVLAGPTGCRWTASGPRWTRSPCTMWPTQRSVRCSAGSPTRSPLNRRPRRCHPDRTWGDDQVRGP